MGTKADQNLNKCFFTPIQNHGHVFISLIDNVLDKAQYSAHAVKFQVDQKRKIPNYFFGFEYEG